MNCQMIRVISSPSSSTTGFFTLILAMLRSLVSWARGRVLAPSTRQPLAGGAFTVRAAGVRGEPRHALALALDERVHLEPALRVPQAHSHDRGAVAVLEDVDVGPRRVVGV